MPSVGHATVHIYTVLLQYRVYIVTIYMVVSTMPRISMGGCVVVYHKPDNIYIIIHIMYIFSIHKQHI